MTWVLSGGRLIDPKSQTDTCVDIAIEGTRVVQIAQAHTLKAATVVDVSGLWVLPGLIDVHVHLREPGQEYKEDILSGSRAAAFGGFTTIVAMPNTRPVIDNAELVQYVLRRGQETGLCRVLPSGAVTQGQQGKALAPFGEMRAAGVCALTDDGHPVADPGLMRSALEYARGFDLPVLTHAEEPGLSCGGHMHEGEVSTRLGIKGVPRVSEDVAVGRDILLAEYTGGRLHVCHVSTARAVELIRQAKKRGVKVTGEAAPHHFTLTHQAVEGYSTSAKMNPPLREQADVDAVIEGLKDGTLDAIATDHAPHSSIEKDVPFSDAACGITGLQTSLPLSLDLWRRHGMPLMDVVERMTWGPARALSLPYGYVAVGHLADLVVVNPNASWVFDASTNLSKSTNSPFMGSTMHGWVEKTVLEGKIVYQRG
jgi:dihydroorotase